MAGQKPHKKMLNIPNLGQLFHSPFTFIKRFFSSSLSATRVLPYAYLRLLVFPLAILIPAVLHPA